MDAPAELLVADESVLVPPCDPEGAVLAPLWVPGDPLELEGVELLLFVTAPELLPGLPNEFVS